MSSEAPRRMLAQLESVSLMTDDAETLRGFYLQLGGIGSPPLTDPKTNADRCAVDFCGVRLQFVERARRSGGSDGAGWSSGIVHLAFALGSADAVDELTSVLAAAGHRVLEWPHRTCERGCYESVVLDPDGNRLRLTV